MATKSFLSRPMSYRAGAVLLLISGLLLVVGVASPYWHWSEDGETYGGLWSRCDQDRCVSLTYDVTEGWWLALQVLLPVAAVCATLSCSCLLFENCFRDADAPAFLLELLGVTGGVTGAVGCFLFLAMANSSSDTVYATLSWSFYFAIVGSVVVFVASVVFLLGGKSLGKSSLDVNPERPVWPSPLRRLSRLWARQSPATPEEVRRSQLGTAMSRDFTPFPVGGSPLPGSRPASSASVERVVADMAEEEGEEGEEEGEEDNGANV